MAEGRDRHEPELDMYATMNVQRYAAKDCSSLSKRSELD